MDFWEEENHNYQPIMLWTTLNLQKHLYIWARFKKTSLLVNTKSHIYKKKYKLRKSWSESQTKEIRENLLWMRECKQNIVHLFNSFDFQGSLKIAINRMLLTAFTLSTKRISINNSNQPLFPDTEKQVSINSKSIRQYYYFHRLHSFLSIISRSFTP